MVKTKGTPKLKGQRSFLENLHYTTKGDQSRCGTQALIDHLKKPLKTKWARLSAAG